DPQQGPDGWPYLITETQVDGQPVGDKNDSTQKIIHWLSTRGIGLVVNPRKLPYPDYVFSYGMLWSFRETGYFIKFNEIEKGSQLVVEENAAVRTGPPTKEYLPDYVRQVLKDFFRDQSVFDAKILMISTDGINYDLCFSLESLGNPPESEHEGILEALAWFLPPHYSLAVISEKGLPTFESL
ncbi:MAG: hypothetical protein ACXVAX_05210, partial [Pseudobdellovibrio sp.]